MKKAFAGVVAWLAFGAVSAVSAACDGVFPTCSELDRSIGGGVFFASDFGGGFFGVFREENGEVVSETVPWFGGGVHAFSDAKYAEFSLDLALGVTPKYSISFNGEYVDDFSISFIGLGVSLLLKYPFELTGDVSLFPAFGIDYAFILYSEAKLSDVYRKFEKPNSFSALWFKFGGGLDVALAGPVFLRPELLYGIRLANKFEKDLAKNNDLVSPALGHGLTIKVGLGYKID
jgi:hypothetical protein